MDENKSYLEMANYEHRIRVCFLEFHYVIINVNCSVSLDLSRNYTDEEIGQVKSFTIKDFYKPLSADILRKLSGQGVENVLGFFLNKDSILYNNEHTFEDGKFCFAFSKAENNVLSINSQLVSDIKIEE